MKACFQQHQDLSFLLIQRLNNFIVLFYLKFWKKKGKIFTKCCLVKKVPLHQKYPSETGEAANDCWKNISVFTLFQWKYLDRRSVLKRLSCFLTKDTGIERGSYSSVSATVGRCPVPFSSLCAALGVLVPLSVFCQCWAWDVHTTWQQADVWSWHRLRTSTWFIN